MTLLTLAKDLNDVKNQYDAARRTLIQKQEHLYKLLIQLVTDVGGAWKELESGVREQVIAMAEKTNFKFDPIEYNVDNLDEIVWSIGNQFPVYNESCEPIADYPLSTGSVERISVVELKNAVQINVEFTNMDGFEITVNNDFINAYFNSEAGADVARQYLIDEIEKTYVRLYDYFEKNSFAPQSDSAARMKRLQEEAAALGLRLVSDK